MDSINVDLEEGDTITALTTLTAIADPAAINSILFDDPLLGLFNPDAQNVLNNVRGNLRNGSAFGLSGTVQQAPSVPDSGHMLGLLACGLAGLLALHRPVSSRSKR
jgi:hypothetical protein